MTTLAQQLSQRPPDVRRLAWHERSCSGWRDWWHVVSGEHIRLARWDCAEASFMVDCSFERLRLIEAERVRIASEVGETLRRLRGIAR